MKDTTKSSFGFFSKWMGLSIVGWIIGVFSSILLIFIYSGTGFNTKVYNFSPRLESLIGIFMWLPLGFSIGILQSHQLRRWNIKWSSWVWVTALEWWLISFCFVRDYSYYPQFIPIVVLSALLGAGQVFVLRSVFAGSGEWIVVNMLGALILVSLQSQLFTTSSEEISILVFPFIGTLTIALPTGLLLASSIDSKPRNEVS